MAKKELGILMSPENILSLLAVPPRKLRTMRPIKNMPMYWSIPPARMHDGVLCRFGVNKEEHIKPRYPVGSRLYVKENFWDKGYWETDRAFKRHWVRWPPKEEKIDFYYDADGKPEAIRGSYNPFGSPIFLRKHPSIFMKKADARIWIPEVTAVTIQRPQDLSIQDCVGEGIKWGESMRVFNDWQTLYISCYSEESWVKNELKWVYHWKEVEVK